MELLVLMNVAHFGRHLYTLREVYVPLQRRKGDHWARKWTGYRPYSLLLIAARDADKQKVKLTFVPYKNARHNGHMEAKFRV